MTETAPDRQSNQRPPDTYAVPADADTVSCEYCGAPFADREVLALHRGIDHPNALSDDQREAFEDAYGAEQEAITVFRLKALGALVALYFGLFLTYAVVT